MSVTPHELIMFLTGRELDDALRRRIGEQMDDPGSSVARTMREVADRSEVALTDVDCWTLLERRLERETVESNADVTSAQGLEAIRPLSAEGRDDTEVSRLQVSDLNRAVTALCNEEEYDVALRVAMQTHQLAERLPRDAMEHVLSLDNLARVYYETKRYGDAEPLWRRALEIRVDSGVMDEAELGVRLSNLAAVCHYTQRNEEALGLSLEAVRCVGKAIGEDTKPFIDVLDVLAGIYDALGEQSKARGCLRKVLATRGEHLPRSHPDVMRTLQTLARLETEMECYDEALSLYGVLRDIEVERHGPGDVAVADVAARMADTCVKAGKRDDAEGFFEESLRILTNELGEDDARVVDAMRDFGEFYVRTGSVQEAEPLLTRALDLCSRDREARKGRYRRALSAVGALYEAKGEYVRAERYFLEALELARSLQGEDHLGFSACLNNLGMVYIETNRCVEGCELLERAAEIRGRVFGEQHSEYAVSLENLARGLKRKGDLQRAISCLQKAIEISVDVLGDDHPTVANSLEDLGKIYYSMGIGEAAQPFYERALEIRRNAFGEQHRLFAKSVLDLGMSFYLNGKYLEAEARVRRSVELLLGITGEKEKDYAHHTSALGLVLCSLGRYEESERLLREAVEIHRVPPIEHFSLNRSLASLAELCFSRDEYGEAADILQEVMDSDRERRGEHSAAFAGDLHNLGITYAMCGRLEEAESLLTDALRLRREFFGENSGIVASTLNAAGMLHGSLGEYEQAEAMLREAIGIDERANRDRHPVIRLGFVSRRFPDYVPQTTSSISISLPERN